MYIFISRRNFQLKISQIEFKNHPILQNLKINLTDKNGNIYSNIVFVGENGCGKTTLLNELFDYDDSQYIINKEQNYNLCGECGHKCLYVAQDLKYRNAINVISNKISNKKIYKDITDIRNTNHYNGANIMSLNKNNIANDSRMLKDNIVKFENEKINSYFNKSKESLMSDVSKIIGIDGNIEVPRADKLSSGEQELILRLEAIKNRVTLNLDILLIDEPETSLHPKWQLQIIPFLLNILKDNNSGERNLQLFIASHSENVLKSVFNIKDTLIVRLYKKDNEIKSESITNMDTKLDIPSVSEIQYLVFDIPSIEYHNQLYGKLLSLCGEKQANVENYLKDLYKTNLSVILNPYNYSRNDNIETLPTYIRNASSHTENTERIYNENDLMNSIKFLRFAICNTEIQKEGA